MTTLAVAPVSQRRERAPRKPVIGLVAGGLGAYWPQFPDLLPRLRQSADLVAGRLRGLGAHVVDVGFVSDPRESEAAADRLRVAGCDLVVVFVPTYFTATMALPLGRRTAAPVLFLNMQPDAAMEHATADTAEFLAFCGSCPLPEFANVFARCGLPFRSVSGHLGDERAWSKVAAWVAAAGIRGELQTGRFGLMGHLYPGMYDVSADLTAVVGQLGGHVEILEFDDLRVRVDAVSDAQIDAKLEETRDCYQLDGSVNDEDLRWAAGVAVGLDALVTDFSLTSLAYYHRGLEGEIHERLGAGMILGASSLTARGVPAVGEYELRTSLAMLMLDRLGAGGSFTELQALDFERGHVEMGHDGPAHTAISARRPLLRGLGVFHGKRGHGVSVEFDVRPGPVTLLGLGQGPDGRLSLAVSQGQAVHGPLMKIGNTTSRIDFGGHPGDWMDAWSRTGIGHHWALGTGHRITALRALSDLLELPLTTVGPTPAGSDFAVRRHEQPGSQ